jgi:putative hydrolase of the HAD superfamily
VESPAVAARPAALLFDFGGTLDAPGVTWKERAWRLYRGAGVVADASVFDPVFYKADDALVGAVPSTLTLAETVQRVFAGVSTGLGVADPRLTEQLAGRFVDDTRTCLAASAAILRALAGRYRLGIVSNFYGNLTQVCDDAGIRSLFGVLVDSAEVGCTKPAPRIFRHALDALGVSAAKATFVGDSLPRDMAGARGVGMRHIWLVGAGASAASPCCRDDRQIRSLRELEAILL